MVVIKASEQIFQQANSNVNKQVFGSILYNVMAYGADNLGLKDSTSQIQATINACAAAGGGVVFFPAGTYLISAQLNITKSVYLVGVGKGSDTSNTNGSGIGVTTIKWNGALNGLMIYYKSATINNYLFGGGMTGILLDGASLAGTGVRCSSVGYTNFTSLEGRNFKTQWILIDAGNGVLSQFNFFDDLHFVYGASAATMASSGLVLDDQTAGKVTQNIVKSIVGLVGDGALLYIGWSDNNQIGRVMASRTGTGNALFLANGPNTYGANNNVIEYVSGYVNAQSKTAGNRIINHVSEGAGISFDAGAQFHYGALDYLTGALFETHRYKMVDRKFISVGDFVLRDGSATAGVLGSLYTCWNLADAAFSTIGVNLPADFGWDNGTMTTLRLIFSSDVDNTAKNYRTTITVHHAQIGGSIITPSFQQSYTIAGGAANVTLSFDVPLSLPYVRDDLLFITIQRAGADALDTATGNLQIIGASLYYTSAGPRSSGSGTYAVPPAYKGG